MVKLITNISSLWLEGQFYCYLFFWLPPSSSFLVTEGERDRKESFWKNPGIHRIRWPTTIDPLSPPLSAWTVKISMSTTLPSLADQRRGSSFPFCLSKFKTTIINMDLHTQHLYLGNQFTTLVSFDRKIVALSRKHSKWKCFRKSDCNNLFVCVRKCTESCIRTMQGSSSLNKGCLRRFPVSRIKHWHGLVSGSLPQCWAGILDVGLTHSSFPLGLPSGCQCLVVIQTLFFWCDSGLASPR